MPNAISNKEQVAYIAESSWGTTPATPTGRIVRYNSLTDTASYNTTKSAEITNSREVADLIYTSAAGGLQINSELSYDTQFEDWIAALLASTWSTNVVKIGTTRTSFSFERAFPDITQYQKYLGAVPTKMSFGISTGNVITCNTTFQSKFPTMSGTTVWSGTTAAGVNTVMTPLDSIQVMQEGGAGSMSGVTDFSMELTNNVVSLDQLSSVDPADLALANFDAQGTFSLYFADSTYYTKYANRTATSLAFTLGGAAAKKYAFSFAKVKLTALGIPNPGMNKPLVQKYSWVAYKDATDTTIKVTRTP